MAYPDAPTRDYSYTAFQQSQGDNAFPGTFLDVDLNDVSGSIQAIVDFLKISLRPDGRLAPGTVSRESLGGEFLTGVNPPHPWVSGTVYALNDTVSANNSIYIALEAHTAGAEFDDDLEAERWGLVLAYTSDVPPPDDSVGTAQLQDEAVTFAKIEPGAVTGSRIGDGSLFVNHASPSFGVVPIGTMVDYAGINQPARWLYANGQAVSRTTYPALLAAITRVLTGTVTAGSAVIIGLSEDLRGIGLEGSVVEAPGIPAGSTVTAVAATTITVSALATSSGADRTVRLAPYGLGDGVLTFNVPDRRGVVSAGRTNMGGTDSGRLTGVIDGTSLATIGGASAHTLTQAELPTVTPAGAVSSVLTAPTYTQSSLIEGSTVQTGTGFALGGSTATTGGGAVASTFAGTPFGGGAPHSIVQPTGISNTIIFAGA